MSRVHATIHITSADYKAGRADGLAARFTTVEHRRIAHRASEETRAVCAGDVKRLIDEMFVAKTLMLGPNHKNFNFVRALEIIMASRQKKGRRKRP